MPKHKHKLEYRQEGNYELVWVCILKECTYEERRYIECS